MSSVTLRGSVQKQFGTLVMATVSFIVALAWNQFFTIWIGSKKDRNVRFSFFYAVAATVIGLMLAAFVYYKMVPNGI